MKNFALKYLYDLPIEINNDSDYLEIVKRDLGQYRTRINLFYENQIDFSTFKFTLKSIKEFQFCLIDGIIDTLDIYFDGLPNKAYEKFREVLDSTVFNDCYKEYLGISKLPIGTDLCRLRSSSSNYLLDRSQLFHIPFNLKHKIRPFRYSILGVPSLYLGSSLIDCWEELDRPNIHEMQFIRYNLNSTISLLDLRPPNINVVNENKSNYLELFGFFMKWPLIYASSFKVKYPKEIFKQEYIIPQFLLHYVHEKKHVMGIMYESNRVKVHPDSVRGLFYNIVIPCLNPKRNTFGYSDLIARLFSVTKPYAAQIMDILNILRENDIKSTINDYDEIKISNYENTLFGQIELKLKESETEDLINYLR